MCASAVIPQQRQTECMFWQNVHFDARFVMAVIALVTSQLAHIMTMTVRYWHLLKSHYSLSNCPNKIKFTIISGGKFFPCIRLGARQQKAGAHRPQTEVKFFTYIVDAILNDFMLCYLINSIVTSKVLVISVHH